MDIHQEYISKKFTLSYHVSIATWQEFCKSNPNSVRSAKSHLCFKPPCPMTVVQHYLTFSVSCFTSFAHHRGTRQRRWPECHL